MSRLPERQTRKLRKGRLSVPGATYFVTCCTQNRLPGLTCQTAAQPIVDTLRRLQADGNIDLKCATTMEDHLHLLRPEFAEGLKDGRIPQAAWLEIAPSSKDLFPDSP